MSTKDDGGPAYPTTEKNEARNYGTRGMTLRDAFALEVVSGILMHVIAGCAASGARVDNTYVIAAHASYELADAMMEARK